MKRIFTAVAFLVAICAPALAGTMLLLGVGVNAPAITLVQPVFSTFTLPVNFSNEFGGSGSSFSGGETGVISATSTTHRVPIPFPAKITNLQTNLAAAPSVTVTIVDSLTTLNTAADGTVTCQYLTSATNCSDNTHSDIIAQGTLLNWHWSSGGTITAQAAPGQVSYLLTSTNGNLVSLTNQPNASTGIAAGPSFYGVGASTPASATETLVSFMFCPACTGQVVGLAVIPNVTETGPHTWTLNHNGSAVAAMTCTTSSSSTGGGAAGCCINNFATPGTIGGGTAPNACTGGATPVTIAAGDTISITGVCTTTCATAQPGISVIFAPTTPGVVPLGSTANGSTSATPGFYGLSNNSVVGAQNNMQIVPASMTFSNLQHCTLTNPGGAITKTVALQVGATPGTAPTTPGGGPTVTWGIGSACPGSQSATWLGGASDTTHTLSAIAGNEMDTSITSSSAVGAVASKVGLAVTVP